MTPRYRVAVTDFINDDLAPEREVLDGMADVTAFDAHDEAQLAGRIDGVHAVMLFHNLALTAATIDRLTDCKIIVRCGVGYDNVDRAHARRRGIPVANVPDYGTEEVADTALGMALSLARGIHTLNSKLRRAAGAWSHQEAAPIRRLRGETFGIIGLGRIGAATALRAKSFGMRVLFYDPYLPDGVDKAFGLTRAESLDELLGTALIVSLNTPLTEETENIINRDSLTRMRRGAYLVNTGRGGLVDGPALIEALATGHLAGAGVDVLPKEPPGDDDPVLRAWRDPAHPAHDRLILNPHSAFYSEEGLLDMRRKGAEACRRALLGETLRNVVN